MHPTAGHRSPPPQGATHPAPAPEHARLAAMTGTWDVQMSVWEKPGVPPLKSRGFSVIEPLFGGLFIQERVEALVGETAFVTLSWTGFDPATRRYQATHIASTGAALHTESGPVDDKANALVLEGDGGAHGGRVRRVVTQPGPDTLVVELFELAKSGEPWRSAEIRYTRRKG